MVHFIVLFLEEKKNPKILSVAVFSKSHFIEPIFLFLFLFGFFSACVSLQTRHMHTQRESNLRPHPEGAPGCVPLRCSPSL